MTIINIDEHLAQLTEAKEELEKSLEVVKQRIELLMSYETMMKFPLQISLVKFEPLEQTIQFPENSTVHPSTKQFATAKEPKAPASLIAHCGTFMEACEVLADSNDGVLALNKAAREIKRVGLSRAKKVGSITATLHSALKKRPGWEFQSPGVFQRIYTEIKSQQDEGREALEKKETGTRNQEPQQTVHESHST